MTHRYFYINSIKNEYDDMVLRKKNSDRDIMIVCTVEKFGKKIIPLSRNSERKYIKKIREQFWEKYQKQGEIVYNYAEDKLHNFLKTLKTPELLPLKYKRRIFHHLTKNVNINEIKKYRRNFPKKTDHRDKKMIIEYWHEIWKKISGRKCLKCKCILSTNWHLSHDHKIYGCDDDGALDEEYIDSIFCKKCKHYNHLGYYFKCDNIDGLFWKFIFKNRHGINHNQIVSSIAKEYF